MKKKRPEALVVSGGMSHEYSNGCIVYRYVEPERILPVDVNKEEYSHVDEIHYLIQKSEFETLNDAERKMLHEWTQADGRKTRIKAIQNIGADIKTEQLQRRDMQIHLEFFQYCEDGMKRSRAIHTLVYRHNLDVTVIRKIVRHQV